MRIGSARRLVLGIALAGGLGAAAASAEAPKENGCVYNREIHRPGEEICQGDMRKRCDHGAWVDIGTCREGALEAPKAEGGDQVEPPPPPPPRKLQPR
jgi:hypothetical protein